MLPRWRLWNLQILRKPHRIGFKHDFLRWISLDMVESKQQPFDQLKGTEPIQPPSNGINQTKSKHVAPSSHHKAADFKSTKSYGSVLRLRQWLRWSPTLAEADGGENRHCVWPSLPSGNLTYGFRWLIEIEDLPIYLSKMVIFDGKLLNSQMVNGHQECLAIATLTMLHVDDSKFTGVYVCNVARDSCPTSNVRVWSKWPHSPLNIPNLDGWKLNKERQCWIFDPPVFNPSVLGGKSGELKIQDDPKIRGLSNLEFDPIPSDCNPGNPASSHVRLRSEQNPNHLFVAHLASFVVVGFC